MEHSTKEVATKELKKISFLNMLLIGMFSGLFWSIMYSSLGAIFAFLVIIVISTISTIFIGIIFNLLFKRFVSFYNSLILVMFFLFPTCLSLVNDYHTIRPTATGLFIILVLSIVFILLGYGSNKILNIIRSVFFRRILASTLLIIALLLLSKLARDKSGDTLFPKVNRVSIKRQVKDSNNYKVAVIGVDGGEWNLILPLLKKGELPHFSKLMQNGMYGRFISMEDAKSPVVWTSIFSGLKPEKHKIDDWIHSLSTNRQRKTIWNILNEYGKKGWVVSIPATFPMEEIQHGGVAGFPLPNIYGEVGGMIFTTNPDSYTFATEASKNRAKVNSLSMDTIKKKNNVNEIILPVNLHSDFSKEDLSLTLANKLNINNFFINKIYNLYNKQLYKAPSIKFKVLSSNIQGNSHKVNFYVKNFEKPVVTLHPNEWSKYIKIELDGRTGYFAINLLCASSDELDFYVSPVFKDPYDLPVADPKNLLDMCNSEPFLVEGIGFYSLTCYDRLVSALYDHLHYVMKQHHNIAKSLISKQNWDFFFYAYLVTDRVQHAFWRLHEPEIFPNEELNKKLKIEHGDLINLTLKDIDKHIGELLEYIDDNTIIILVSDHGFVGVPEKSLGDHKKDGIFLISGPPIKKSMFPISKKKFLPDVSIYDMVPTILYLLGYPVGKDMDGEIVNSAIKEDFLNAQLPKYLKTYATKEADQATKKIDQFTKEQLKSLGYIK